MEDYLKLYNKVVEEMPVKVSPYSGIIAVKASTVEQYELARKMWVAGKSPPPCTGFTSPLITISGEFTGEDWYIIEEHTDDFGMEGQNSSYRIVSLSEKKKAFELYCKSFEEIAVAFEDTEPPKEET